MVSFLKEITHHVFVWIYETVLPAFRSFPCEHSFNVFYSCQCLGYTYPSKGGSLQENVNLVYEKIPKRYRDNMRFGTRNEFLRGFDKGGDNANNAKLQKKLIN